MRLKNVADMSAEEKLDQIRHLLRPGHEEEADATQNGDTSDVSIPVEAQPDERDAQSRGSDEEVTAPTNVPDGGELILNAFRQARVSGKPDWDQMTTATLKSRMLSLTERAFREGDYGVDTLTEFIQKHDNLVSLDTSVAHPIVKLLNPDQHSVHDTSQPHTGRPVRIRRDLWHAVLDRSSGEIYSWDPDSAQVKTGQLLDSDLVLPTVGEDLDREWRRDFIEVLTGEVELTASDDHQLMSWSNDLLSTYRLPSHLIPRWNRFLTSRVVTRISDWFEQLKLELPKDLYDTRARRAHSADTDTEQLRQLVLTVVQEMTEQELSNLILPPRAILRATRSHRNA